MKLQLVAIVFLISAQSAHAGIFSDCKLAIEANDQSAAKRLAQQILTFNSFSLDNLKDGEACLSFAMDQEYVFNLSLNTFLPKANAEELVALAQATAARKLKEDEEKVAEKLERQRLHRQAELDAEAVKQAQTDAVWYRVIQACEEIYAYDPNAAVTNKVCLDVFLQVGLPED